MKLRKKAITLLPSNIKYFVPLSSYIIKLGDPHSRVYLLTTPKKTKKELQMKIDLNKTIYEPVSEYGSSWFP